jgi:hypothetical protein
MTIDRRSLPTFAGLAPLMSAAPRLAWAATRATLCRSSRPEIVTPLRLPR